MSTENTETVISINHVSKVYKLFEKPMDRLKESLSLTHKNYHTDHFALEDISLEVHKGECVGIIGTNGSGKSTLLKAGMGLLGKEGQLCRGKILYDGKDLGQCSEREMQKIRGRELGMVFQMAGSSFCPIRTLGVQMQEAVRAHKRISKAEFMDEALDLLNKFGFDKPDRILESYPFELSGGMQQRTAIARALATNPKVLLCDEATSALDPNTTHSILTLIKDINQKLGITVVVITHQMSVVEEICDSVAILDGGVVMEEGSVQEIFANPKTAAAKRLVAPNGGSAARDLSSFAPDDHVVRVTFNGSSTAKPLVASLAAEKGILVSVLSADTRDLSGQCYGSMLLNLPADVEQAKQAAAYMRSQPGVTVEEVTGE